MKKINLRGLSEILSEKELKNVMGGSGGGWNPADDICIATKYVDGHGYYDSFRCYYGQGAAEVAAEYGSGTYGWWCCNCSDANTNCFTIQ